MREHDAAARRMLLGGTIVLVVAVGALAAAAAALVRAERAGARDVAERTVRSAFEAFVRTALEEPAPEREFGAWPGFTLAREAPVRFGTLAPPDDPESRFRLAEADRTGDPRLAKAAVLPLLAEGVATDTRIAAAARWARADLCAGGDGVAPGFRWTEVPAVYAIRGQGHVAVAHRPGSVRFLTDPAAAMGSSGLRQSRSPEALLVRHLAERHARVSGAEASATRTLRRIAAGASEPDASIALSILAATSGEPEVRTAAETRARELAEDAILAALRAAEVWPLDGVRVRVAPLEGDRIAIGRAGSERCTVRVLGAESVASVRRRTLDPVGVELRPAEPAATIGADEPAGVGLQVAPGTVVRRSIARDDRRSLLLAGLALAAAAACAAFAFFVRAVRRETAASAARADFVSTVSHELRTPIAVMRTAAETLLADRAPQADDRTRMLTAVLRESERLSALVGNVLDFSRIDSGTRRYAMREVAVEDVVEETVRRAAPTLAPAGLAVAIDIPAPLPRTLADPEALGAALSNLLDNAARFRGTGTSATVRAVAVPRGEIAATIRGRPSLRPDAPDAAGAWIILEVIDHGIGVPASEKPRVFERFFRGSDARVRETRGSGIGLSLVRHTAEAHGGIADVRDTPGGGATFRIALPVRTVRDAADAHPGDGAHDAPTRPERMPG